jgi:hypothetical protein
VSGGRFGLGLAARGGRGLARRGRALADAGGAAEQAGR